MKTCLSLGSLLLTILLTSMLVSLLDPEKPKTPKPTVISRAADDLSGIYSFQGKDGPKQYGGSVQVTKVRGCYLVLWNFTDYTMRGTGYLKDGSLLIGWFLETPKTPMVGVHSLKLLPSGDLDGTWLALPGKGEPQVESWKYLGALPKVDKE